MKRFRTRKIKYRKNNKKIHNINIILIIVILVIIVIIYLLKMLNTKIIPEFNNYSEIETKKIISSLINETVINEIANNTVDDLFITTKDDNGNVVSVDFDSKKANKLLLITSTALSKNLKYLESGEAYKIGIYSEILNNVSDEKLKKGVIYEIPIGIIFNNIVFNNLLPKVPVKIDLISNVFCKLNTEVVEYGINNALIKINIEINVQVKILLPLSSKTSSISVSVPVVMKALGGAVPGYYLNGFLNSPYVN